MSKDTRIGVFICHCGSNIAGIVHVPSLVSYATKLEDVVYAEEGRWSCSVDYLNRMKEVIREKRINRVVVAACSARTHESLFKRTIKEAGLNPFLLEFVSIREQASWVHMYEPEAATKKAMDLIKMGVAKARLLEEGEEIRLPVGKEAMVIGGGVAGITAALALGDQGFKVFLVEREQSLGGILRELGSISVNNTLLEPEELLERLLGELGKRRDLVEVLIGAEIVSVEGYIGNYKVKVRLGEEERELKVSTVIVATGIEEIIPGHEFLYGMDKRIITQKELETRFLKKIVPRALSPVFINCVLSKNEVRGCCNIGCLTSLKNAMLLKEIEPFCTPTILFRDLNLPKEEYNLVAKAREMGIRLIRFDGTYPQLEKEGEDIIIKVQDLVLGREIRLRADLVILTTALKGNSKAEALKGLLKVSTNQDGFFQESHVKLGPVDFATSGIFLCGGSRYPKHIKDTMEEAMAAAMRASIPMNRGYVETEGIVATISLKECNACGLCYNRCPYHAIKGDDEGFPHVIEALCKGCGLCAADCPRDCIEIIHFRSDQILAQIEAALEEEAQEKIIGFVCHWCALGGVDMAGVSRLQYPPYARLIRVMCSARISKKFIYRAFELGARGVLVAGCEFPTCHYISGNYAAEKRLNKLRKVLRKKGIDPGRLWNVWCSAADGPKFANTMREMAKALGLVANAAQEDRS